MNSAFLQQFDPDWAQALTELSAEMHPVDRDACLIWFQFFPLGLHDLVATISDSATLGGFYQFRGTYRLGETADTSHRFLYSHRYWPEIKKALERVEPGRSLAETVRAVAARVEGPSELTLCIAAVGVMTLRQIGPDFLSTPYTPPEDRRSPDEILRNRTTGARRGFFALRKPRVIIDERNEDGWFPLIPGQHITTAAERDKRPHHKTNPRCSAGNGPIPVDCRSGTCGTCWVGVLGGTENLSAADDFERKRMEYFGYWESPFHIPGSPRPLVRLACQTIATDTCSIVIPPWNGVWSAIRRKAHERLPTK
jgi:ferredoxin